MSTWGTLTARFVGPAVESIDDGRIPRGSEGGPTVSEWEGAVHVEGRLRDVEDLVDSPAVLAWFAATCGERIGIKSAALTWEIDRGPRYRWVWTPLGGLQRLRGVLD